MPPPLLLFTAHLLIFLQLLQFIPITVAGASCIDRPCEHCPHLFTEGDVCGTSLLLPFLYCDSATRIVKESPNEYLRCDEGQLLLERCPPGAIFIPGQGCTDPTMHLHMHGLQVSGSGRVGDLCQYNTDCLSGMYCSGGVCICLSTYILRESYCYEKINPNQPGCTYDVQCEAVWPGAKCSMDSSVGTCRCPEETHVARETRDGWVCVSLRDIGGGGSAPLYFACPLPEGAGFKIALNDPNPQFGSFPVGCTVGSSASTEPVAGLHGGGACMWPSDGEFLGDIYDCIHTSPHVNLASKFPGSSYASSADGVCCPSRALACIAPQATGPNPTEPRWWYNAVTGTCQQFMWDPTAAEAKYHSANNFKTIQHCESYCRDTCQRGSPQYTSEASILAERPLTTCATSIGCANDYQCTSVGSQHLCCPTPAVVCSMRGGRPMDINPRNHVYHAGFLVSTGRESIRFYYDPTSGRCKDFIYKGAGGNFNNFLSKNECEMYCERLQCERGSPLRVGENAQHCQANSQCPSSHECKVDHGVCCPRKQTICAQPLRVGDCTENVKRYWYNAKTRQCQMFEYTGCQGNDNNFESIIDCQAFCKNALPEPKCIQGQAYKDQFGNFVSCQNGQGCPANFDCYFDGNQWGCCPVKAYTCSLNADSGVQCGAGSTFKFFYNSATQNCDSFQYNGCDGNSNNFASRDSCEQYCSVGGCPNGGTPLRDHQGMMRVCGGQQGECPESHECTPVVAGTSSVNRCCPTRAYLCGLPPQQGSQCAAQPVTRYYFNIVTGQCATFQFGGCDGNQNNFLTIQQCRSFCMSNSCPAGNIAYVDPNSQLPIHCNEALSNSCPAGYECTFNPLINNHVCCGAHDLGVCPDGEKAYIDTLTLSARECVINLEASCPSNYLCRFHLQKNKYYCCASTKGKTCPSGRFLWKDPRSSLPARCTMGRPEQCPDGFSCQSYLADALQGFCCTSNSICPDDAEYVVDDQSQQPRVCTMGSFVSCPSGYTCRSASSQTEGYCCRASSGSTPALAVVTGVASMLSKLIETDGCPPGNFVYLVNGDIGQCDPFNPPNAPCPDGFTCQWSMSNQRYQCCGSNPAPAPAKRQDGCPSGQLAFKELGSVKVCTAGSSSCPVGYFCQFSSSNNQFQCCGVSGGCPMDAVAFVGLSGEAERCVIGQSNCPEGFACQRSHGGSDVCCTVKAISCSDEEVIVENVCYPRTAPGQACVHSQQCTGGSSCSHGVCVCPQNMAPIGNFCRIQLKCATGQIMHNDLCHNLARVGEGCLIGKQCPEGAGCMDGVCECKRGLVEKGDRCIVPPVVRPQPKKLAQAACSKKGFSPLRDEETGRVISCNPGTRPCPAGKSCQINWKKTQYICCSPDSGTVTPEPVKEEVCPAGRTPYLLNGKPQKCTQAKCPGGFDCIYRNQDYFCCASLGPSKSAPSKSRSDCRGGGSALLHPATRTAVLCSPLGRSCPASYACQASLRTSQNVCCPVYQDQIRKGGAPCPDMLVLVARLGLGGKIEKRCERACPYPEVPVGGVCYELRRRNI